MKVVLQAFKIQTRHSTSNYYYVLLAEEIGFVGQHPSLRDCIKVF